MSITRIYGLVDPRDGKVRYVGRTAQPLSKRLRGHFYKRRIASHTRRDHWIALLLSLDAKPEIVCLAIVEGNGFDAERWWIAKLKSLGMDLVNSHEGGGGCIPGTKPRRRSVSPEQRAKIKATLKGRRVGFSIHPENMYAHKRTDESEKRRRDSLRVPASEERKRKSRESNIETWSNPELRRVNSERTKVQASTVEWKEKYREVQKNAWAKLTSEQRQQRCRKISEGIKASARGRWA